MASAKLRIALASHYPSEDGRMSSGVEGVVAALADGLAEAGADVHVVTCVTGLKHRKTRRTEGGVTVHSIPSPGKLAWLIGFPVETSGIRSALREIDPDIVHCHTQTVYSHAALERGWPSVITIHGVYRREVALMRGWRRFQGVLLTRFERDALRRARHIVCISSYLVKELGAALEGKDVRCIANPVDERYFGVQAAEERGRILYAGTIIRRKNLLGLLEAVRQLEAELSEIKLRVAGSQRAEPGYYEQCARFVEDSGLSANVDFLGALPLAGMLDELAKANLLVLPSYQETAPMVISEAMAAGKPIVATAAGGTADMFTDGEAGFVVPFDDNSVLAHAIRRILDGADLRARMGVRAREIAGERHRLARVVDQTLAFYHDVLDEEAK